MSTNTKVDSSACAEPANSGSEQALDVEILSSSESFEKLAGEWASLLARSSCDALFNSWPWQFAWWQTWSRKLSLEVSLVCVRESDYGRLVGLLPLCFSPQDRCFAIPGALPRSPTFRSELLDVIVDAQREVAVLAALKPAMRRLLLRAPVYAGDVPEDALIRSLLPTTGGWSLLAGSLTEPSEPVFLVNCSGKFTAYLAELGRNTRLKLFNRRSYLKQHWPQMSLDETPMTGESGKETWTSHRMQFDEFHQQRWNKPFLGNEGFIFQGLFITLCSEWNHLCDAEKSAVDRQIRPVLSILECDGKVVSMLYDVIAGDTRYNLQMGYNDSFDSKVSLGTLHLGHAMEASFTGSQSWYNFLAGSGRDASGSYKTRLATDQRMIGNVLSANGLDLLRLVTIDLARELKELARTSFR